MRKTKLFTLVTLSALMAACSQDEFVTPAGDTNAELVNRPVLGEVTIDLGEADTRLAFNGSFNWKWEDGDQVGAAIVDVPVTSAVTGYVGSGSNTWTYADYLQGVKKDIGGTDYLFTQTKVSSATDAKFNTAEALYTLNSDNHISSNYPYLLKNEKFTSQANLVEGNYLFYAPYDQAHLTREPLSVVVPMKQDCSEKEVKDTKYMTKPAKVSSKSLSDFYKGTTPGFEKALVAVGHKFLAAPADRTQPIEATASMKDVFAYPMFTIKNNYNGYLFDDAVLSTSAAQQPTIVLDSIHVYTTTAGVEIPYKKDMGVTEAKNALTSDAWSPTGKYTSDNAKTSALYAGTQRYNRDTYFAVTDTRVNTKLTFSGISNVIDYRQKHITCDLGGKELAQGETYHFHAIMPAENYEDKLYAKVFVRIGGKRYVIYNTDTELTVNTTTGSSDFGKATVAPANKFTDWNFRDIDNGGKDARLIRGEHYPAPELNESGVGTKNFAGKMLTINLTGGKKQAAFALTEADGDYGFEDNKDMIEYMTGELQRGVNMAENDGMRTKEREEWKGTAGATVGNFAFAAKTKCIINEELVKALRNTMYQNATTGNVIKLDTNLPIASDVKIIGKVADAVNTGYTIYTFETLDESTSYEISLKDASATGTIGALTKGINLIGGTAQGSPLSGELKLKNGETNAVVILNGASANVTTATLKNSQGISAIYVNENTTLNEETACSSLIVMNKGEITIGQNGSLTNENNDLKEGTINNTNLKGIAGKLGEDAVVKASAAGFPTTAIAAGTKINSFDVTGAGPLTIEQAHIDMFTNLSNVTITLTTATAIKSANNVTLNNIKSFTATNAAIWDKAGANSVVVTHFGDNVISNVTEATGNVSFVKGTTANE